MGQWPKLVTDEFAKTYWLFQSGQSVPAIFGAEDDDTDDKPDDKDDGDKGKSETDSDDGDDDEDEEEDDDEKDDKPDPNKLRDRMKAADRRASKAERELADLRKERKDREDSEKTELQRAQDRVKELEAETAAKDKAISDHRVQLAFYSVNDVDWVDPADALAALDLSEVETDENGKINKKQLRKAIRAVAADKPHWVKTEGDSSTGASGSKMNGKRKGEDDKPDRKKLEADFPALRNRV